MNIRLLFISFLTYYIPLVCYSQTTLPSKKVKYYDDKIIKLDTLYYNQDDDDFTFRTQRNYKPLLEHLNKGWGHKNKKEAHKMAYEDDSFMAFPYWMDVKELTGYPMEVEMVIDKDVNSEFWDININIYDQDTKHERQTIKAKPHLESLIKKYLIPQKKVLHYVTSPYLPNLQYQLSELVNINPDWTYKKFQAYIDTGIGIMFLPFDVDKNGTPYHINPDNKIPIPPSLDSFIKTLDLPIVIRRPQMDTLEYGIMWYMYMPSSASKGIISRYMEHLDALLNAKDSTDLREEYINWDEIGVKIDYFECGKKRLGLLGNMYDTVIYICDKQEGKWKIIDSINSSMQGGYYSEDLDSDGVAELLIKTYPNMNGNQWTDVFKYDSIKNKFSLAGNISTEYTLKQDRKEIWIEYGGSWYMPLEKTILVWKDNKLVTKKYAKMSLKMGDMKHGGHIIKYYENPGLQEGKKNLILKLVIDDDNCAPGLSNMWDDFFE